MLLQDFLNEEFPFGSIVRLPYRLVANPARLLWDKPLWRSQVEVKHEFEAFERNPSMKVTVQITPLTPHPILTQSAPNPYPVRTQSAPSPHRIRTQSAPNPYPVRTQSISARSGQTQVRSESDHIQHRACSRTSSSK